MQRSRFLAYCVATFVAAGMWGVYWIPQRVLVENGLTGGWGTIPQFALPLVPLIPFVIWRAMKHGKESGVTWCLVGLFSGGGIVCYAYGFILTEVVRALLLFYMLPVWATLLERFFLGRPVTPLRYVSLTLALAGVWFVLGQDGDIPLPTSAGDWLALAGGALTACAATRVDALQPESPTPILFSFCLYGSIVSIAVAWLLAGELGPPPDPQALWSMLPFLLVLVFVFMLPSNLILISSPAKIGAGVFGILLLSEILFGVISAALWANEPFGWREVLGSILVLSSGCIEVFKPVPAKAGATT